DILDDVVLNGGGGPIAHVDARIEGLGGRDISRGRGRDGTLNLQGLDGDHGCATHADNGVRRIRAAEGDEGRRGLDNGGAGAGLQDHVFIDDRHLLNVGGGVDDNGVGGVG